MTEQALPYGEENGLPDKLSALKVDIAKSKRAAEAKIAEALDCLMEETGLTPIYIDIGIDTSIHTTGMSTGTPSHSKKVIIDLEITFENPF